jgi:hypothetical protein
MVADGQRFLVRSRQQQALATLTFDDTRLCACHQKLFDNEFRVEERCSEEI